MSNTPTFTAGEYDEQTERIIVVMLDDLRYDTIAATLGRVQYDREHSHSALFIGRRDGKIAVIGHHAMREIVDLLKGIPLIFNMVVSCSDLKGSLEFRLADNLELFEPPAEKQEDPFDEEPKRREVSPEIIASMRRASGDGDLVVGTEDSS